MLKHLVGQSLNVGLTSSEACVVGKLEDVERGGIWIEDGDGGGDFRFYPWTSIAFIETDEKAFRKAQKLFQDAILNEARTPER